MTSKQKLELAVIVTGSILLFVIVVWFSNVARDHHDNEVRRQTLEVCKEIK